MQEYLQQSRLKEAIDGLGLRILMLLGAMGWFILLFPSLAAIIPRTMCRWWPWESGRNGKSPLPGCGLCCSPAAPGNTWDTVCCCY